MSGFTNLKVLDLLNHDDLSRRLMERQRQQHIQRVEIERSLVPITQKRQQLAEETQALQASRNNLKRLRSDDTLSPLLEIGERLVEQALVPLAKAVARLDDVLSEEETLKEARARGDEDVPKLDAWSGNNAAKMALALRSGRPPARVFRVLLDATSSLQVARLQQQVSGAVDATIRRLSNLPAVKIESGTASTTRSETTVGEPVLETRELLSPDAERFMERTFTSDSSRNLAIIGAQQAYGQWRSPSSKLTYPEWANQVIKTRPLCAVSPWAEARAWCWPISASSTTC